MKIAIDFETYIGMLQARREHIAEESGSTIPDEIWNHLLNAIEDGFRPQNTDPKHVVDDLAIHGSFDVDTYSYDDSLQVYIEVNSASRMPG